MAPALCIPQSKHSARVLAAFWLFGLINNTLYVVILSAALDLVGPTIPKGVVLLADVVPSFLAKLIAPYFIHVIPYAVRIPILIILSAGGMLLIAASSPADQGGSLLVKLVGIALASLSSGLGELSFLGLTHFYGTLSLAAWSSGTGGAGFVGAGAYVVATSPLGLSSRQSLFAFAFLPVVMLLSFFVILPSPSMMKHAEQSYERVAGGEDDDTVEDTHPLAPTLAASSFVANLARARSLFFPYMLPLLLVYIAEYTINQGVAPTLLFPLASTPFKHFRDFYPTYNAIYQVGVFISRSSTPFVRVHHLYAPSLLQILNLAVLTLHAMFDFLPNVYIVFAIVFWEGLLGGLVYVNTFAEITDNVPLEDREFSLSATTVSDSGGICIAALLSMGFETSLCRWQVDRGRDFCRQT